MGVYALWTSRSLVVSWVAIKAMVYLFSRNCLPAALALICYQSIYRTLPVLSCDAGRPAKCLSLTSSAAMSFVRFDCWYYAHYHQTDAM